MSTKVLFSRIHETLHAHAMPQPPARLLVALSGGADSVALLLLMHEMGYTIEAAHCNFQLRGEASMHDERFVRNLCARMRVPLHVHTFDTRKTASAQGISIEMAARNLRYEWFETLRAEGNFQAIAVAHHRDDANETLLLNLVRGSGVKGLCGMPHTNGHVIRPLLDVGRQELLQFLAERNQDYVTDSSNADVSFKRNRIRHEVIPVLRKMNPDVDRTLSETRQRMREAARLCEIACEQEEGKCLRTLTDGAVLDIASLRQTVAPLTIFTRTLQRFHFSTAATADIFERLDSPSGACFESDTHWAALHRGQMVIRKKFVPLPAMPLPAEGVWEDRGLRLTVGREAAGNMADLSRSPDCVCLDADCLQGSLHIRSISPGDRFVPLGMKGSKLVSDYLTDRHRSVIDKRMALVVCDDEGIVWLVNERPAARMAVRPQTRRWLRLSVCPALSPAKE